MYRWAAHSATLAAIQASLYSGSANGDKRRTLMLHEITLSQHKEAYDTVIIQTCHREFPGKNIHACSHKVVLHSNGQVPVHNVSEPWVSKSGDVVAKRQAQPGWRS